VNNIEFSNTANLPTTYGDFTLISFKEAGSFHEHCLLIKGDVKDQEDVIIRIHSECLTGDIFTSLKCDCGPQLNESLRVISERGQGMIIYLRQEGRGIGLFNKVNAYALQDKGQDTVQANHSLGFETDLRDFSIVLKALDHLGIKSVNLLTNNPDKIDIFQNSEIKVNSVMPLIIEANSYNEGYLNTKKEVLNHLF